MATKEEKEAKALAQDAAVAASTTGKSRLQAEVATAAKAFSGRRLRAAGDLSRYKIGGFLDDPMAQITPKPTTGGKPTTNRIPPPTTTAGGGGAGGTPRPAPKPVGAATSVAGTSYKAGPGINTTAAQQRAATEAAVVKTNTTRANAQHAGRNAAAKARAATEAAVVKTNTTRANAQHAGRNAAAKARAAAAQKYTGYKGKAGVAAKKAAAAAAAKKAKAAAAAKAKAKARGTHGGSRGELR